VAVVIPCHRVVRGDGKAGGYRWGEERKSKLLRMECGVSVPAMRKGQAARPAPRDLTSSSPASRAARATRPSG
jgi:AraC family transcriptional regulator of adaptative response/methylated-DNA-[protein]-cysteine methyltransferase